MEVTDNCIEKKYLYLMFLKIESVFGLKKTAKYIQREEEEPCQLHISYCKINVILVSYHFFLSILKTSFNSRYTDQFITDIPFTNLYINW